MKKVLILAYDYPPYISVGGMRPHNWYKSLHQFDVCPVVVTRQWSNKYGNHLDYVAPSPSTETIVEETEIGTTLRSPYFPNLANRLLLKYQERRFNLLRKVISGCYVIFQFVLPIGPKREIYNSADEYLKKNKVDVIIATGDPFILFKYAQSLSKKYDTPWIADYRDLWSQFPGQRKMQLIGFWNKFFEKRLVKSASSVTVVSEYLKSRISDLTGHKNFTIIPNGYDKEAVDLISDTKQTDKVLSLAMAGTIYEWNYIEGFLGALAKFVELKGENAIRINLYGINIEEKLTTLIATDYPTLTSVVVIHPPLQNDLLLVELMKNNMSLLFNYYTFMGTKIYEYLGINRSILFCFTEDSMSDELKKKHFILKEVPGMSNSLQEDLIREKNAGYIAKDTEHLLEILLERHQEFKENGYISCNTINSEEFSRTNQTKNLADLIHRT